MKTDDDVIRALMGKRFVPADLDEYEVDGVVMSDYPDFADAYLAHATWKIDNTELTDDELYYFDEDNRDWVYEVALENCF